MTPGEPRPRRRRALTNRARLVALALVPLLALIGLTAVTLVDLSARRAQAAGLGSLVTLSNRVTDVAHHLQAERGATNTFVASGGTAMRDKLPGLRGKTDEALAAARGFLADPGTIDADALAGASQALSAVAAVGELRRSADAREKPGPDYVAAYTALVTGLLDALGPIIRATDDAQLARRLAQVAALGGAKEKTGLERAQIAGIFAKDTASHEQQHRVGALISARDANL